MTKFIAYYGFKGGLGRTVAAACTAVQFARQGKRVLLIDADLEAPGISLTSPFSAACLGRYGLIDHLLSEEPIPLNPGEVSAENLQLAGEGRLSILGAGLGQGTDRYPQDLDRLSELALSQQGALIWQRWLGLQSQIFAEQDNETRFDVVILDLRTGLSMISGMLFRCCALGVIFVGLNEQNRIGANMVLGGMTAQGASIREVLELQGVDEQKYELVISHLPYSSQEEGLRQALEAVRATVNAVTNPPIAPTERDPLTIKYHAQVSIQGPLRLLEVPEIYEQQLQLQLRIREDLGWGAIALSQTLRELLMSSASPNENTLAVVRKMVKELYYLEDPGGQHLLLAERLGDLRSVRVPMYVVEACAGALGDLRRVGVHVLEDWFYEVNQLRLQKLRWETPCAESASVRVEYERLYTLYQSGLWNPRERETGSRTTRMRIDYADAILQEQKYRLHTGQDVQPGAIRLAMNLLLEVRGKKMVPGTAAWYARTLANLARIRPFCTLEVSWSELRDMAESALSDPRMAATGSLDHWAVYTRIGLILSSPDGEDRTQPLNQLLEFLGQSRYAQNDPAGAYYDRAVILHHLGRDEEAISAAQYAVQERSTFYQKLLEDEDLEELRPRLISSIPRRRDASA